MNLWKKGFGKCMLTVSLTAMAAGFCWKPVLVKAEVTDESTYDSSVAGSSQTYYRTIATNYHAGSIPGLVTITTAADMETAVGIGAPEKSKGYEPVLFVADYDWKSDERKLADRTAQEMNGTLVAMLDIQLFRYEDTWFAPVTKTEIPVKLVAEIPEKSHKDGNEYTVLTDYREYVMIRVHNGEVTVLKDLDDDLRTLTFETDQFSAYGLAYIPIGAADEHGYGTSSTAAESFGQNDTQAVSESGQSALGTAAAEEELDEVPKTGDILWDIEYGYNDITLKNYARIVPGSIFYQYSFSIK